MPGAAKLLSALPDRYWAVVTSGGRAATKSKLSHARLRLPEFLISGDDVATGKPNPEGYLKAAAILGVPPAECVVVEDSPAGLEAARNAGMVSIGVASSHAAPELNLATFLVQRISAIVFNGLADGKLKLTLS